MVDLHKLSVNEIKELLKKANISQSGDKGTLIYRYSLYSTCVDKGLTCTHPNPSNEQDLVNPFQLKMSELKVACSRLGISPIGNQDELLDAMVKYLVQNNSSKQNSTKQDSSSSNDKVDSDNSNNDAIDVARKILQLGELEENEAILSIGSDIPITKSSSIATMRKAYLRLSMMVHPDKLSSRFSDATKAFQALVKAFEYLSRPPDDDVDETGPSNKKSRAASTNKTIARSNDGCYVTNVCCPRCHQSWTNSLSIDGNPTYFYNFIMMGIKQYHCSTCLFQFGCMTAEHRCPHCKRSFEYSPHDYHRKITCLNEKCKKQFGFFMFTTSDRILNELKKQVKDEQEQRMKALDAKRRRANRAIVHEISSKPKKQISNDSVSNKDRKAQDTSKFNQEEKAFILGLIDECPRCGQIPEIERPEESDFIQHLNECVDKHLHAEYSKKKLQKEINAREKLEKQNKQDSVQTYAAWEFLGSNKEQLWLLDDEHLQREAIKQNIDVSDSKSKGDTLKRLVVSRNQSNNASAIVTSNESSRPIKRTIESIPSNLHSMSKDKLLAVCFSHSLLLDHPNVDSLSKSDVLEVLEHYFYESIDECSNEKQNVLAIQ